MRRELSDEEIAIPAVGKMLVGEIDRLEDEVSKIEGLRDDYHDADKRAAVLTEKLAPKRAIEVVTTIVATVGGVAMGFAKSYWTSDHALGVMLLVCGLLLIIGSAIAKLIIKL